MSIINRLQNKISEHIRLLQTLVQRKSFWLVLLSDILLVVVAHLAAYAVRFEFSIASQTDRILSFLPLIICIKIPVFYIFGLYRGMWRYTSFADVRNVFKASVVSSGLLILMILYLYRFQGFSRAVFCMDAVFTFLFITFNRGIIRYFLQEKKNLFVQSRAVSTPDAAKRRLLLIGAGSAAEIVIREIQGNKASPYTLVGLIDDDKDKLGLKIHGITVLGNVSELEACIDRCKADEILIAVVTADGDAMKRLVDACRRTGLPFKIVPSLGELIQGDLSVSKSREVDYRDLLGRPVIQLDHEEIGAYLEGKNVLVTGAGGSIGTELCRQLLNFNPGKLILLDISEANLYGIQMELEHEYHFTSYHAILGNCGNVVLLKSLFQQHQPTVVFHAAAYKHVPLVEMNPWEGIINNVEAFQNLFSFSAGNNVGKFVLVSSDKAVRPTNIMGATKRIVELIMHSYCNQKISADNMGKMDCMAVRFGNVLGSSGSVIPLFKRQIESGGPVTVTDKRVTRYFMAIEEAAQLILQAGAMGRNGEIFLLKMGESIKIDDLARDLITLLGKVPESEIKIIYTGLRPGEKLFEELITEGEGIVPTTHDKIMVLSENGIEVDRTRLNCLYEAARQCDEEKIRAIVAEIVPEYTSQVETA